MWKAGQKLVCVKGTNGPGGEPGAIKGEIYTFVCVAKMASQIHLLEFPEDNTKNIYWGFKAGCFRPIDEDFGEVIAEYIEETAHKEYQYQEALK